MSITFWLISFSWSRYPLMIMLPSEPYAKRRKEPRGVSGRNVPACIRILSWVSISWLLDISISFYFLTLFYSKEKLENNSLQRFFLASTLCIGQWGLISNICLNSEWFSKWGIWGGPSLKVASGWGWWWEHSLEGPPTSWNFYCVINWGLVLVVVVADNLPG